MDLKQVIAGTVPTPDQNLINPSRIDTAGRQPGYYRAISLDVFSLISAGLFGYSYYRYLTGGWPVWAVIAAMMFFGVMSVLQAFINTKSLRRFVVLIFESVLLVAFFYKDNFLIVSLTAFIVLVLLFWGYVSGRGRIANSVEIPFFGASGTTLGKFTTAALIFMILIYTPQINAGSPLISENGFSRFFDWTAGVIQNMYPGITLKGSFGNFAQSFTEMELKNNPTFQTMSTQQQSSTVAMQAAQFTQAVSQSSGQPISSSSPASDAFYNVVNGFLGAWQEQSGAWFAVGWGIVLFLALRSLGVIFVWLGQFISLIFYEILLASGFIRVAEESHNREYLTY